MIICQVLNTYWDQLVNRLLPCSLNFLDDLEELYVLCICSFFFVYLLDWGLYRDWVGLTDFDSMFHLHLVHCITHSSCFLVCFMVHWTKFLIAKVVCNCLGFVKLFHLFTDLPLNGSHTYSGPSSLFWTLLDIMSCLYKLLIYSLNSILQNWSCSHLLLHYQPIIKFQTFISTPWSSLAF
jgi:hypothetical protein